MTILIFGTSGATGKQLVTQALEKGYQVEAFVRDPAKLVISHERLTLIRGNVSDYPVVNQAIRGKDAVISALGADSPFKFDQVLVDGMANIIRAMESAGVERLIYLSALCVTESRRDAGFLVGKIAPIILRTEVLGHEKREKMIRQSKLKWTIVHAPLLKNGPMKKNYRSGETIRTNAFAISLSRADVADFMLKQLTDESHFCKSLRLMPK